MKKSRVKSLHGPVYPPSMPMHLSGEDRTVWLRGYAVGLRQSDNIKGYSNPLFSEGYEAGLRRLGALSEP